MVWNNECKQQIVGYSQLQQLFKVFSFGIYKGPKSFSPLVDRFVDNRLFKVSPKCPFVCCHCHGNCRWFSTALNLLLANLDELMKCNCLCQKLLTSVLFDEGLPESYRLRLFLTRIVVLLHYLVKYKNMKITSFHLNAV